MNRQDQHAKEKPNAERRVFVSEADLPVHCPMPQSSLWNSHPRVYIPLGEGVTEYSCPYCGTQYVLKREDSA